MSSSNQSTIKTSIQRVGKFLSGMVMPNIGAFIAWGLITALFIPTGWMPNEKLSTIGDPMIKYLLPLLIAYTGGKAIAGQRGGVIGAAAAMGVIVGADIPMFIGAMIMGPFAGWVIKKFDKFVDGKIPTGFEMLVNNFFNRYNRYASCNTRILCNWTSNSSRDSSYRIWSSIYS